MPSATLILHDEVEDSFQRVLNLLYLYERDELFRELKTFQSEVVAHSSKSESEKFAS